MESFKPFECIFLSGIVCSFQKYGKPVLLARCDHCEHYLRFVREMEEEEDKFFDEVDKIRSGELEWFTF